MQATYMLLIATSVLLSGFGFGAWYANKKGKDFSYKPILILILVVLFLVSLYGAITGQPYNEVVPFIS